MGHFRPNPKGRWAFRPHTSLLLLDDSILLSRLVVAPSLGPKFPASRPRYVSRQSQAPQAFIARHVIVRACARIEILLDWPGAGIKMTAPRVWTRSVGF